MRDSHGSDRRSARAAVWIVALLAGLLRLWCSPPWADDLIGGDEGYYGLMARNVLASPAQVLSPSLIPLGPPGDKPPLVPILIAASVRAFGVTTAAVRIPSILCGVLVPALLGLFLLPVAGPAVALAATTLYATLPWFADAARIAAAEPPLTLLGLLALLALARFPKRRAGALIAGVLLGAAFLCKLWLVAPLALACVAFVAGLERSGHPAREAWGSIVIMTATAFAVGALHLIAVAWLRPQDLEHWRYIYLGRALAERVSGEGYPSYFVRPGGAYWASATRAFGLALPFVALGVADAWRSRNEAFARALLVWAAGILLLSCFRVQSGGYAYVVLPAWAGLAALGADALRQRRAGGGAMFMALAVGALASSPLLAEWGGAGLPVTAWAAIWIGGAGLCGIMWLRPQRARVLVAAAFALVVALGAARTVQRLRAPFHTPGYAAVAADLAPLLAGVPAQQPCVLAPEAPVFAYHLFRTAAYWATPDDAWSPALAARIQVDTTWRVFVVDTTRSFHGGWPDDAMLAWLEREMDERPAVRPGGPLRVFVRRR